MRLKKEKSRHQAGSKVRFDMSGRNQKRKKIEYCVREQRGTTLVELIVTFALIGLFMAAASVMMTTSLRLFTRMQATSRAVTVSDMILDKVAGEISAAVLPVGSPGADDYYFWLESSENGNWVAFKNRLGSPVAIFAAPRDGAAGNADAGSLGSGELFVRYYELVNGEHVLRKQPEVDWRYDDQVYMGYRITKLSFSQADRGEKPGVIKIDLTLKHEATGFEYSAHRFARVYNAAYTTGDYLGERNEFEPGNSGLPGKAEDFEIKEKDEEQLIPYTIYYYDEFYNDLLEPDRSKRARLGEYVRVPDEEIPYIAGYIYDENSSTDNHKGILIVEGGKENKICLFYKKVDKKDEFFQGIIPIDKDAWWRTPDTVINNDNGHQTQVVLPGGIGKWETDNESYYYVVINRVVGDGYTIHSPHTCNENLVFKLKDEPILDYEEVKSHSADWVGAEYHGRVFWFEGHYYVYIVYEALKSPAEAPKYWYKIP